MPTALRTRRLDVTKNCSSLQGTFGTIGEIRQEKQCSEIS